MMDSRLFCIRVWDHMQAAVMSINDILEELQEVEEGLSEAT